MHMYMNIKDKHSLSFLGLRSTLRRRFGRDLEFLAPPPSSSPTRWEPSVEPHGSEWPSTIGCVVFFLFFGGEPSGKLT